MRMMVHFHVRSEGQIVKKAVYIAIGISMDRVKDVLGLWIRENESTKFWLSVINRMKNRGVEDILIIKSFWLFINTSYFYCSWCLGCL